MGKCGRSSLAGAYPGQRPRDQGYSTLVLDMGANSDIEWTEATWNPVSGCSKVSPGCAHCYAERISRRFGHTRDPWLPEHAEKNVAMHPQRLDQPLRWRRPRMIFVDSMSDLFHERVPLAFVRRVFEVMERAEQHTFQ